MKSYICFPGGKFKVLTMSYDDGKLEDRQLISIFNKHGIKGTFHINSGMFAQEIRIKPDEFSTLYKGHEIACHTLTHPTIARCPLSEVIREIGDDRANLEKITHHPVQGLSYPNGSYSKDIEALLPGMGIKYSRIVGDSYGFELPENLYEWKATCHHNHRLLELGEQFCSLTKKQYLYMMYVWGHSFEFERNNNWEIIEEFCEMIANRDDIWYATNSDIVEYNELFDRLEFFADNEYVHNPSVKSVWLAVNNSTIVEVKGGETVKL